MRIPLALILLSLPAVAQIGSVPGTDVVAYDVNNCQVYGRRGAAYPNGEVGLNIGHGMCNNGTTNIPWVGTTTSGVMTDTYPKIASIIARESDGRMVQVSGRSFAKYSRTAFNLGSSICGTCQSGPTQTWHPGCFDAYSSGFSNITNLGPTTEVDPWTGHWSPFGSYFDRGLPEVTGPAASDGIQSPMSSSDPLQGRMIVPESELVVPGTFWGQVQVSIVGEPGNVRMNNAACRPVTFTWNGTSWTGGIAGSPVTNHLLEHWTGAQTSIASNGVDDGHFMVGWKVTGPVDGFWHYEFAVHNIDNASAAASLRIPMCPTARVRNVGFHDIDKNALNQWTFARTTDEIAWLAATDNAIEWNTLYNFWFDCDAAPTRGSVAIDRARPGAGAPFVAVASEVPGGLGHEYLGAGCGAPAPQLFADQLPLLGNATYSLRLQGLPNSTAFLAVSTVGASTPVGSGCTLFVDGSQLIVFESTPTDGSGTAVWNLPIPPVVPIVEAWCQAGQFNPGGPYLTLFDLSNGLRARIGASGCP